MGPDLEPTYKVCIVCLLPKIEDDYHFASRSKCKRKNICKSCASDYMRVWNAENKERKKENSQKWYLDHKEYALGYIKEWRINNPERVSAARNKWERNNRDSQNRWAKQYRLKTKKSPKSRLNICMSTGIYQSLRKEKAGRHWESLVDYTVSQLKKHLEKQFEPGMSWENYGPYWHIDHKIPIAAFNYQSPEDLDFRRCWELKNLQPLEAKKNRIKNASLPCPFQPSLLLAQSPMTNDYGRLA